MGRWEPDAAGRLRAAAMQLFAEHGYDRTTVADIADRAGVTARTFFRHYSDKREVLFAGSDELERHMLEAMLAAPPAAGPLDAVAAALLASADVLGDRRDFSRLRQQVIAATPELRERELIKLAALAAAFEAGLRQRGVAPAVAALAAETGVAVFRVSFQRWVDEPDEPELTEVLRATLLDLAGLTGLTGRTEPTEPTEPASR